MVVIGHHSFLVDGTWIQKRERKGRMKEKEKMSFSNEIKLQVTQIPEYIVMNIYLRHCYLKCISSLREVSNQAIKMCAS